MPSRRHGPFGVVFVMDTELDIRPHHLRHHGASHPLPAKTAAVLSDSIALTERAAAMLRAYLDTAGLRGYRVFASPNFDLQDIDQLLPALGEAEAAWEPAPAQVQAGHTVCYLSFDSGTASERPSGFLRLFRHEAVLARWTWVDPECACENTLLLVASPSAEAFHRLNRAVATARRKSNDQTWQVIGDCGETRPPRGKADETAMILPQPLLDRIRGEVMGFFTEAVAALYRGLGVGHRRGVLLYGPPGNGKTSLIRWIGASLPEVAAISLKPWESFNTNDLSSVLAQWTSQAPAILVLEDLDWLLEKVNVSTFLNQLDGLGTPAAGGGLLLIATTNHPEKLDPAVNNRPGRFDACIELPCPDAALRQRFLSRHLPDLPAELAAKVVAGSDGFSFAHLQELLRLSGLRAINAGRTARSNDDVLSSLTDVKDAHAAAIRGYPAPLDMPFGLGHLRKRK
jgi:hypothetical protein